VIAPVRVAQSQQAAKMNLGEGTQIPSTICPPGRREYNTPEGKSAQGWAAFLGAALQPHRRPGT